MAFRIDKLQVDLSRQARRELSIHDTLSFVEDGDFLAEFRQCGLTDEDLENVEAVITVFPDGGEVVPVSRNIRDLIYVSDSGEGVVIRYVYLRPSTVLLLQAYYGESSHHLTIDEARIAEGYISHQLNHFAQHSVR